MSGNNTTHRENLGKKILSCQKSQIKFKKFKFKHVPLNEDSIMHICVWTESELKLLSEPQRPQFQTNDFFVTGDHTVS